MRSALPAELNCQHGALARIHCLRPFRRARGLPARRKVCPKSKSSASVEPLLLGHSSGCPIHIFGVEHLKHQVMPTTVIALVEDKLSILLEAHALAPCLFTAEKLLRA